MIGKWFHTIDPYEHMIEQQGQVIDAREREDGEATEYLVQLYSWVDGEPTDQFWLDEVMDMKNMLWYESDTDMREAWERQRVGKHISACVNWDLYDRGTTTYKGANNAD